MNLPCYNPDFNADEAIWGWARQEVTANLCLGAKAVMQDNVGDFFTDMSNRRTKNEMPMPDRAAGSRSRTDTERPNRFPPPRKCTSHLGFSLVLSQTCIGR